jgi:small neutral amino acid transporter SnatA (MarC family)
MGDHEYPQAGTVEPAGIVYEELTAEPAAPPEFLPLAARRVLYILGLVAAVGAPILAVTHPDYAAAIVAGGGLLTTAALGTALANPSTQR